MFYIMGTHKTYGNDVWLEVIGAFTRPHVSALHAEAFAMDSVETVRRAFGMFYPEYQWYPIPADTSTLVPANMRKVINA